MYDEDGYGYPDSLNNVTHVGHANLRVAAAANRQIHKLNTNSRFIYEGIATYADKLVSTFPNLSKSSFSSVREVKPTTSHCASPAR
jgi:4-aminobutyrate aminotransferase-like enzyme